VLASGSKGNSTVVASSRTRILLDAGLSCRELMKRMAVAGEDPAQLDAILITHEHQDHVHGLGVLARRLRIPVFITEPTHRAWVRMLTPRTTITYTQWLEQRKVENDKATAGPSTTLGMTSEEADSSATALLRNDKVVAGNDKVVGDESPDLTEASLESVSAEAEDEDAPTEKAAKTPLTHLPAIEFFRAGSNFSIGDIAISSFTIPHDAADPCGFVFEAEGIRIGIATDLGYIPTNVKQALRRCDVMMLESNHDLEMLRDGPYPWAVKQRVMSRVGHLSNNAAANFLADEYDGGAAYVVLAHLSESNNLPALARVSAEQALAERMNLLGNQLRLAEQSVPLEAICL